MMTPTAQELADLRRKAYKFSNRDLAAAIAASGIPPDLMPLNTACQIACVTRTFVRRRIRNGTITPYRVGQRILISLSALFTVTQALPRNNPPPPPRNARTRLQPESRGIELSGPSTSPAAKSPAAPPPPTAGQRSDPSRGPMGYWSTRR